MISKLEIQNFRLFTDFQIDNLARVNLFVGLNNSGKSTLLEAIYLLANSGTPDTLTRLWGHRRETVSFRLNESTPESRFYALQHLFHRGNGDSVERAEIRSTDSSGTKKYLRLQNQYEDDHSDGVKVISSENDGYVVDVYGMVRKTPGEGENGRGYAQTSQSQNAYWLTTRHLEYSEILRLWNTIEDSSEKRHYVQKFLHCIEPDLLTIGFTSSVFSDPLITVTLETNGTVTSPIGNIGDGMRAILGIALALLASESGILLVDEIDSGLHHTALVKMWEQVFEIAQRFNVQVFATAHSWDCVKAFSTALQKTSDKAGALFRLEPLEDQIRVVDYTPEMIAIAVQQVIEVR
jgi:hypothetical protein